MNVLAISSGFILPIVHFNAVRLIFNMFEDYYQIPQVAVGKSCESY